MNEMEEPLCKSPDGPRGRKESPYEENCLRLGASMCLRDGITVEARGPGLGIMRVQLGVTYAFVLTAY